MHRLHRAIPFAIGVLIASGGAHANDSACDPALEHFHLCKSKPGKATPLRLDAFSATSPSAAPATVAPLSLRPVVVTPQVETWTTQFPMLSTSIQAWADHAGYTVMWKATTDRNLPAPLQFRGTFEEACRQAFDLYHATDKPLFMTIVVGGVQRLVIVSDRPDNQAATVYTKDN